MPDGKRPSQPGRRPDRTQYLPHAGSRLPDGRAVYFHHYASDGSEGPLDHILSSTGIPGERCRKASVEADNLSDIKRQLDSLRLPASGNHYYVNLTSGTKVMSIALYHYFTQPAYAHCCSIFYVPIGRNAYLQVYPEAQRRERPIGYRISLREYLAGYGITAEGQKGEGQLHRSPAYTAAVLPRFLEAMDSGRPFALMMKGLRDSYRQVQQKETAEVPASRELAAFLRSIGYPLPANGLLGRAAAEYLIGGWLEEWAYARVKESLGLPDAAIRYGVKVALQRRQCPCPTSATCCLPSTIPCILWSARYTGL
ncbi:MAG: DUF1887 family protein [Lewinellaceae bacterium]|nr:DUF1887 family protein [Lewinellaceae bacterium]